jgi:hypothetical protein
MSHSTELRTRLQRSIEELESELAALRGALAALDAHDRSARPAAVRRRSRRAPGAEIVPAGKIESLLGRTDGITTAELARETNGGHEQILTILKELEHDGKAHRSGTRRSTRWHAGPISSAQSNGAAAASERAGAAA